MADSAWFFIGRRYGHHVLRILCKLSLEPTVCVRRTQNSFGRRRAVTLMIAKFVPGLATLAPPVAGQNGMGLLAISALRRHRRYGMARRVAGHRPLLRRHAPPRSKPVELGWPILRRLAAPGHSRLLRGPRPPPPHGASKSSSPPASSPRNSSGSSMPASRSTSSTCAIPSNCCRIPSPSPALSISRPRRWPRATMRFPATATSSSFALAPAKPPPPRPP